MTLIELDSRKLRDISAVFFLGLYRPKFGPQFLTAQNLGRSLKIWAVNSEVLQSAGFDYQEDGVQKHVQLDILPSRFGISPDIDVAASKRKYIEAILTF